MKRCYSLKKNKDFHFTHRTGKSVGSRPLVMIYAKNRYIRPLRNATGRPQQTPKVRVGFSVSKKIGNSVVRNRVKRRLREAFSPMIPELKPGYNIIFIAREPVVQEKFETIQKTMRYLLRKADLFLPMGEDAG